MNPIIVSIANKIAFIIAAWFVHKGVIAADMQTAVESDMVGIVLGLISVGVSLWQSYQHKNANAVVAQVNVTHPEAVAAAQIVVNGKTPNGV